MSPELAKVRAGIEARYIERTGGPAAAWRAIPGQFRSMLIQLSMDFEGDAAALARRPWGAFTPQQQSALAAMRKSIMRELAKGEGLA